MTSARVSRERPPGFYPVFVAVFVMLSAGLIALIVFAPAIGRPVMAFCAGWTLTNVARSVAKAVLHD